MIRLLFGLTALCLVFSCAQERKIHTYSQQPNAIPVLHITSDSSIGDLRISSLAINTVIAANIATTHLDILFYNATDKVLEGEFDFPLADGQHISRYAIDINGALREGVVVEKAKGRIAFESVVRKGIDPGLVEKTKGHNFRTRIFPIPAKGHKHIVIAVEQALEQQYGDLLYQLPLYAKDPIDSFSIVLKVIKAGAAPQFDKNGIALPDFKKEKNVYIAKQQQRNFVADQTLAFYVPGSGRNSDIVLTENQPGQTYFYVNSRIAPKHAERKKPSSVGIFWDISSSGEKRDLKKETELLRQYLASLPNVSVSLIPFNIYAGDKEDFTISGGNADRLIKRIETLQYDGGTQYGAIDLSKYKFDQALLFSDGLSTFGKEEMIFSNYPLITINSSPSANYSNLKFIAGQTKGIFVDAGKLDTPAALELIKGESLQVIHTSFNPAEIEDLVLQTTPIQNTGFSFAGRLKAESAEIKIEFGFGDKVTLTKKIRITKNENSDYDNVKRIWASMKIDRLELEFEKNKAEVTKLGKEFSIVTQNTSLIVLDRVEDYVEHEIVPPAELQAEYFTLLKKKQETEESGKENALNEALAEMNSLKEWWNTRFIIRKKTIPPVDSLAQDSIHFLQHDANDSARWEATTVNGDMVVSADSLSLSDGWASGIGLAGTMGVPFNFTTSNFTISNADGVMDVLDAAPEEKQEEYSEIKLNPWKPDAAYLKTLEKTAAKDRIGVYLSLKKQFSSQPSFFIDAARFFLEKKEKATGILVLSNICEMKLEDAAMLRIVANELMEAGENNLALLAYEQVLKLREEEPQSYRDLALACNETGDYNRATDLLYKVIVGKWDGRFGDVKAIALNEMNAIISAHPGAINTAGIDSRFIYAMPVDVRIVISWNADNSDIDLWVTDPRDEKCFYSHKETEIGGRISKDVTQGYGPEEFSLKRARKGNYIVQVNLFGDHRQTIGGPIAIKADLFTDYGKPEQKKETINFRVTKNKQVIDLGSLKFGS